MEQLGIDVAAREHHGDDLAAHVEPAGKQRRKTDRAARLDRLRLRGPRGAEFEFTLAAIAKNLRRLAKLIVSPPPPAQARFT